MDKPPQPPTLETAPKYDRQTSLALIKALPEKVKERLEIVLNMEGQKLEQVCTWIADTTILHPGPDEETYGNNLSALAALVGEHKWDETKPMTPGEKEFIAALANFLQEPPYPGANSVQVPKE